MAKIVRVHDNEGNPAFAASHTKAVKVNGKNIVLQDELDNINSKLSATPNIVYLTEDEYDELVENDEVDEFTEYNIYEDEA